VLRAWLELEFELPALPLWVPFVFETEEEDAAPAAEDPPLLLALAPGLLAFPAAPN